MAIDSFKHWMVALDLTNMDDIVLGYLDFLSTIGAPQKITAIHVVEGQGMTEEMASLFPEIKETKSLEDIIREELKDKIDEFFDSTEIELEVVIKEGATTEMILAALEEQNPDLLALGKKSGYKGEGVLARKISKYTHCSLLFISENSQYRLNNVHLPINFTKASARAVQKARQVAEDQDAQLHIQHVYDYPKQFFPYMPSDKYSQRMTEHLQSKYKKFRDKFELNSLPECEFTVNEGERRPTTYTILCCGAGLIC
ncbi:MAG: universal stress protein [Fodinibius sp.]|nr:universal stress protein [Fodinibius sp.]